MSARKLPRWSLRFNVALLVLGVSIAPLLFVVAWLGMERRFESSMQQNAVFARDEAEAALFSPPPVATAVGLDNSLPAPTRETPLEAVARTHRVRVRVLGGAGQVLLDHDYDWGRDLSERAGGVMLGRVARRQPLDELRGRLVARTEVREALERGKADGCEDAGDSGLLVCFAARRLSGSRLLHVQDSAERPLPLLYALRHQLGRLTLVVAPFALLLAFWVGKRLVGPLEALRDQVLAKVRELRPRPDLSAPANNEIADLAQAFNTLLTRLEERRNENESFVADLVHEFKNPVATIRACGESLGSAETTPARAQRLSRLLLESSTRLDALVSQFLELARAEAGMREEARELVDLSVLGRARVARAQADPRYAALSFDIDAESGALVRGVSERLQTVLDNLLENAASFANEAGTVRVSIARRGELVELRVSDDGPGIAPEDVPRVFERFFTTRRHDRGTGLGLALVRAIVEAHGGQVALQSELGHGATFSAKLPAA